MNTHTLVIATDFSIHRKGCADIRRNGQTVADELRDFQGTTWEEFATWYSAYWKEWTNEEISADEFLATWNKFGDKKPCTGLR